MMSIHYFPIIIWLTLGLLVRSSPDATTSVKDWDQILPSLNSDDSRHILVISTLDGSLFGVNRLSGDVLWKLNNEPRVKVSASSKAAIFPLFLPDPKDGSLYSLKSAEARSLKKLPFSIKQLVASSPCRSSDGIFYMGKKSDSWVSIDMTTGKQQPLLGIIGRDATCPVNPSNSLFIGRTEYNLIMFDVKSQNRHWNITFSDYNSNHFPKDQVKNYAFKHVSSISSGRVKTSSSVSGTLLWEKDFGSPLVAIYLKSGHDIVAVPFTSYAESSLDSFQFSAHELAPTLYIGEYDHGLYALPSLADKSVAVVSDVLPSRLLIGGPEQNHQTVTLGHYYVSSVAKTQLLIAGRSDPIIYANNSTSMNRTKSFLKNSQNEKVSEQWTMSQESKILAIFSIVLLFFVVGMFYYLMAQVREIKQSSQSDSRRTNSSSSFLKIQKGVITIGKISFDTQKILGKGCEGTFVFRGTFDGRNVAVKRLLPESFTVADREVQLLRESDAHPNVIRYFSTEEDTQFKYIALELCEATLQDYVEKDFCKIRISTSDVLKQSIAGLEHLHFLKIVHRDIKPHNILISTIPNVRVMISDFGLCKKLSHGKASFSRRSGITGTEGWIAPEMMIPYGRVTSAVDIFSMGCVFYYTLTGGKHPFGEPIRRQSNILTEDFKLSGLKEEKLWYCLISRMICFNPENRPCASTVRKYPTFWDMSTTLTFLQDVSDRVEKEAFDSEVLQCLETGGRTVCRNDWKNHVDTEVIEDLGKYRTYRGESVRDLLRALRNKKHHYRELSAAAQKLLGSNQESYLDYWVSRFPLLVYHSWTTMQIVGTEPLLAHYYAPEYSFPMEEYPDDFPHWLTTSVNGFTKIKKRTKVEGSPKLEPKTTEIVNWRLPVDEETGARWRYNKYKDKRKTNKNKDQIGTFTEKVS